MTTRYVISTPLYSSVMMTSRRGISPLTSSSSSSSTRVEKSHSSFTYLTSEKEIHGIVQRSGHIALHQPTNPQLIYYFDGFPTAALGITLTDDTWLVIALGYVHGRAVFHIPITVCVLSTLRTPSTRKCCVVRSSIYDY